MSGRGGFMSIGSNNPVNPGNVGNIGGIQQPENANPQPLNDGVEEEQRALQEQVKAKELAKQLDVLLLQASKVSTQGIDAKEMKDQVSNLGLGKNEIKTLNTLIDNAAKTMNELDKFTGRDLALATKRKMSSGDKDYRTIYAWDLESPSGQAIQAALDAQAKLSAKLLSLINTKGVSDEAKEVFETAAMVCDRRSCELETLVIQFSEGVAKMKLNDPKTLPPEVSTRLNTKVFTLMGEKAVTMHGNTEALYHMKESLEPLAKRLEDFTTNPEKSITSEAFASMRKELSDAKLAFEVLARDGYKVGNSHVIPDKAFLDAAKAILEQVEKRMEGARKKLAQAALNSYIDSLFAPPPDLKLLDPKFRTLLNILSPQAAKVANNMAPLLEAGHAFAEDPSPQKHTNLRKAIATYNNKSESAGAEDIADNLFKDAEIFLMTDDAVLNRKIAKLDSNVRATITPELIKEFKKAVKLFTKDEHQKNAFAQLYKNNHTYKTQLAHLNDMFKTIERMGDQEFLTSKTFLSVFNGELAPSTLVEARVHGMEDDDVDPATDQANVEVTKVLGSGNVNTVTAIRFKNGELKVFKPEAAGREELSKINYIHEGYADNQQMAQLNMATQKTADVLGLGDVMVKTSVGKFNGQYGIFMEMAPGTSMVPFANSEKVVKGHLNAGQIKRLSIEHYAKIQGKLMRKCNRLDWFDVITGQGDRHNSNVMVDVRTNGQVDVKGIDNDTCYPAFRIGMSKYIVAGKHLEKFKGLMEDASYLYGEDNQEQALERLKKDPGITENEDGTLTIDASKFEAPELNYCLHRSFGVFSNYVPNVIDKELYDHLQNLKVGSPQREEYLADLKKRLSPAAFDAAVLRLDDAIRHADELAAKNMVYTEEDWNDRTKQQAVYNDPNDQKPRLKPQFDQEPNLDFESYEQIEESISNLTQGNYKRNGFNYSVKIGWF